VLILTTFDRDDYLFAALQAGASGFLLKNGTPEDLTEAIRVLARGDALLAPEITRRVIATFARPGAVTTVPDGRLADLTPREHEVLVRLAGGATNAEIATALHLGETTVKTHVSRVLMKLGLRDRTQAVVYAYENGVVRPGG
jgi:DNA-binding NarL/FixJ family response regulator